MGKFFAALSVVLMALISLSLRFAPNRFVLSFMTTGTAFTVARVLLVAILTIQIVTNPPRNIWFRSLAMIVALSIGTWTLNETYQYRMQIGDTLVFLLACVSMAIIALEAKYLEAHSYSLTQRHRDVTSGMRYSIN